MTDADLAPIAENIENMLASIFGRVSHWAEEFVPRAQGEIAEASQVDDIVEWIVAPELADSEAILGAGFVCEPGLLTDKPWHLAWWLSPHNGVRLAGRQGYLRALTVVDNPQAVEFHDYTRLEWWRVPAHEGVPHLTGPYVDYLCTDELTLTLTLPVRVGGEFVGVFGADLSVSTLEALIDPIWSADPGTPLLLVNSEGRIVASNSVLYEASALMADAHARALLSEPGGGRGASLYRLGPSFPGLVLMRVPGPVTVGR